MTREQLESFFRGKQAEDPWEKQLSAFTVDQVEDKRVQTYVERGVSAGRIPFGYTDKKTALDKLMLISGDRLLNVGMVLFCESLYAEVSWLYSQLRNVSPSSISNGKEPLYLNW